MAAAVRAGQRVVCVTATRGELGSTDPDRWPPGEVLAAVRTAELDAALASWASPSTTGSTTPTAGAPTSTRPRQSDGCARCWKTYVPSTC